MISAMPLVAAELCVPVATWVSPQREPGPILINPDFDALASRQVVLLGESHDSFEHHRWQLHTLAALHARRPDMVIGFEMFPRRVQPVLDRWVRGELNEKDFLEQSEWSKVWNYDPALYLPLFHFARMNRIPMLALNVDRRLTALVSEQGWDASPVGLREGVSKPAPASPDYLKFLAEVYQAHSADAGHDTKKDFDFNDTGFRHFTEGQLTWDRAMAEAIANAARKPDAPLVVGIMGSGHVMHRYGVPHQLDSLGIRDSAVLLAWDAQRDCMELAPGIADAVFGVAALNEPERPKPPRLGVVLDDIAGQVRIKDVAKGSIAEQTGIQQDDMLLEMAGQRVTLSAEVSKIVQRQAPGTWLPIKLRRDGRELEVIAKFPPTP
ncbi:MAG: ChaN family lipoprotein [Gammaproteobacteria bacterium]|nr:ChaN family lipoprotein [Gammaproteobacteria bacterium]